MEPQKDRDAKPMGRELVRASVIIRSTPGLQARYEQQGERFKMNESSDT